MMRFNDHLSGLSICFTDEVIRILCSQKQYGSRSESGGFLFCEDIDSNNIVISYVSLPQKNDRRMMFFFRPNEKSGQKSIDEKFEKGYHYVGDWHSHPEPVPAPSYRDINTIKSIFNKSSHKLTYMFHLIVGNGSFSNAYVCLTDGNKIRQCFFMDDDQTSE